MSSKYTFSYLLVLLTFQLFSQKMEVIRTSAVDRTSPVTNVFVDAENQKWVANKNGLFQVFSPDQGNAVELQPDEWALLQIQDGNSELRLSFSELIRQMGAEGQAIKNKSDYIRTATYHESKDRLWVGTEESGLFEFKTKPSLSLVKRHHSGNTKMASNYINTLMLDSRGQLWVGTYSGAFLGKDGKWSLKEKGFSFQAFAQNGTDVWAMADNLLWKINSRGSWEPIDIDESLTERDVADIAFDQGGLLWVVSEIVARFDPATEEATVFGPAIGFTSQDVLCVSVDQNNGIWIGTNDKGLYLIQKKSSLYLACDIEKEPSCVENPNDGALSVKVSGGVEPYSFKWKGNQSGSNPKNLGPGEYSVTVVDSRGKSNSVSVVLNDPNLSLELKQGKQSSPDGTADGSATVTVKGGKPSYTYHWDSGESTSTAFKLSEGAHAVTVTDKKNCSATGSINIGKEIASLNINLNQIQAIKCQGSKSGSIKIEVAGGQEPYDYKWDHDGTVPIQDNTINDLSSGKYSFTISDNSGQSGMIEITLGEPQELGATIKVETPASTGNQDGKARAEVTGGTGNYQYAWSNGEKTQTAVQLGPTDHSVTVTDEAGCQAVATVKITEDILPLSVSISQKNEIKCAEDQGGSLEASIEGGKGPFRFSWSGGGDAASNASLGVGNYTVTVTDAVGSTASGDFSLKEPKPIVLSVNVKAPATTNNQDGKASAKASGGTGDLTFKWDTGEQGKEAEKLGPGEHAVTATDANGCSAVSTFSISENILDLAVNLSQEGEIKCAGDKSASLKAEISGGKGPFTYQWSKAGMSGETASNLGADNYEVTVNDVTGTTAKTTLSLKEPIAVSLAAKVDAPASTGNSDGKASVRASGGTGSFTYKWDNGENDKTALNLAPGDHTVTVTDEAGCSGVAQVTIFENVLPLSANISQTGVILCAGEKNGALKVQVEGGKAPFSYAWEQDVLQGDQPSGLAPGKYNVTVSDATEKTAVTGFEIFEPQALEVVLLKSRPTTKADTKNGRATIRVSGGTALKGADSNYTYLWDNGETGAAAEALPGGLHTVTVSDANGCIAELSFETKIRIIPELSANYFRAGETIKLDRIYFQQDSTNMDPSSLPTVDELFEFLQENPNIVIEVGGHTNGIPPHDYCDNLSTERSKSVAQYLVDKGIPVSQLRFKGYGKRKPVATNETPEGRAKNQRVEVKVLEVKAEGG